MTDTPVKRALIILGMHRSGTSWLTGSLQQAGLHLAKHHTWNPYNRKGNRENSDVMDLHESILAANHGSWDNPPKTMQWLPEYQQIARQLIQQNAAEQRWGFKDPRTLLVLQGWKPLFDDIAYIGIFRHPSAVANSLGNRSAMGQQQAIHLWLHYNNLLLEQHQRQPFPILCFDWSAGLLQLKLVSACKQLGLDANSEKVDFYDESLRHNIQTIDDSLPDSVNLLYQQLLTIAQES